MQYYIDAASLHDTGMTVVKDAQSQPAYILNGRRGFANDGYNLHTISGQHLGEIRQRTVGMFPRYDLLVAGQKAGSIKKMFGVWHEFVFVSDLNWIIVGNLLANEYHIYHGVKAITTIAAVGGNTGTVFRIDIKKSADVPAGLLIAAILDRWRQGYQANPLLRHATLSYGV